MTVLNVPIQLRRGTLAQMPATLLAGEVYIVLSAGGVPTGQAYCGSGSGVSPITLQGAQGPAGAAGTNGTNGTNGARGSLWYEGAGAPGTISGQINNDLYLNVTNGDVYQLQAGSWANVGNIKGANGATGATGATGPAGPAPSGTPNKVVATDPSGAATNPAALRALVVLDIPALPESQITGLVADLAAKAPSASPALTGVPTAPTAVLGDDSTTIATTAFVENVIDNLVAADIPNITEAQVTGLVTDLAAKVATTRTVNTHPLSADVVVSASDLTTGTLPHAQLPALVSLDIPNNGANTSGTAANLSGTPALPNGTTGTTQAALSADTKLSTDAYVDSAVAVEKTRALAAEGLAELLSHKDAANGYAGLDANLMLKSSEFKFTRNAQTGTTYAVVDSDRGKLVTFNNASPCAVSLAQAGAAGAFADGWFAEFLNLGAAAVIFTIATSTVFGVVKIIVPQGASFGLTSDGTNYVLTGQDASGLAAGMGGFAGAVGEALYSASGATAWNGMTLGAGANGVNVAQTVLRTMQLCGHCSIVNSGVVASSKIFVGLYDAAKNLLIDVAGATGFDGSITTAQTKTFTQVLLLPGIYYYAYGIGTNGSNTNTSTAFAYLVAFGNLNGSRAAKAANAWSASTGLPATLGVLTNIATTTVPVAFFEP